jgi:hypothetical protein
MTATDMVDDASLAIRDSETIRSLITLTGQIRGLQD